MEKRTALGVAGWRRHKLRAVRLPTAALALWAIARPRPRRAAEPVSVRRGRPRQHRRSASSRSPGGSPPGRTQAPRLGPRVSTAARGGPPRVTHRGPVRDGDRAPRCPRKPGRSALDWSGAGEAFHQDWGPSTEACCDSESRRSRPSGPERPSPRLIRGCSEKRAWRSCKSSRDHESCVSWRIWVLKPSCAVPGQEPPAWSMSPVARASPPTARQTAVD
jgi:hypothetical protein